MTSNLQFNRLSKRLLDTAGDTLPAARLRELSPRFYSHLCRVKKERAVLARWGRCVNVDELTGTEIVDIRLLKMIGAVTGTKMSGPTFHAGVQHTYGYLLSTIKTPYGYKRDRWIRPTFERGFGLPADSLHAFPSRGTLLTNLTFWLSMVACRDQRPVRIVGAAPLKRYDFSRLSGWRIIERVGQRRKSQSCGLEIRTDVIPFVHAGQQEDAGLLVYSIAENDRPAKLITTFPVGPAMIDSLLSGQPFGRDVEVRLRFNAHAEAVTGGVLRGTREKESWDLADR